MQKLLLAAAAAAASISAPALAAPTVTFYGGVATPVPGTTVFENFESFAPGASIGTNAFAYANSAGGIAARPGFGSTGNFGAVLGSLTSVYTVNFSPTSIFAFTLGSLDTYNTLRLFLSDSTSIDFVGQGISSGTAANGDQISGLTNGQVSYSVGVGDPRIIGASFFSTSNSFEFDNLAIGAIPEPATWALMLLGFALIGTGVRRRNTRTTVTFA